MNLLITIVLCTSVIIHVVIGGKQEKSQDVSSEDERIHETPFTNSRSRSEKRGSRRQSNKKSDTPYVVKAITYKGKRVYKCNGQIFLTRRDAKVCLRKLREKPKFPLLQRLTLPPYIPPPQRKPPIPTKPSRIPPPTPPRPAHLPRKHNRRPLWRVPHSNLQDYLQKLHII
uniref:FLYWCH-type domain-containing protein n=1 Tax=Strongyloides papillosus TaxID=174720 RepID=A0A0N5BMB4_STREA